MIKTIIEKFKNFDKKTHIILKYGLQFCFILCIISIAIMLTYNFTYHLPILYHIGLSLFQLSITFCIEFIICAFIVDGLKKEMI